MTSRESPYGFAVAPLSRSALDFLSGSATLTVVGGWCSTPPGGFSSSVTVQGQIHAAPIDLRDSRTFDRIAIEVATPAGSAGSVIRLGIYADRGDLCGPGALVLDAGTVTSTTVGAKTATIDQTLGPGRWWLVAVAQGSPATQPNMRSSVTIPTFPVSQGSGLSLTACGLAFVESASGALPAALTVDTSSNGRAFMYRFGLRRSA
jgi:hypothetical protein